MRRALFLLILATALNALIVGPVIYEQDDFGDISLKEFTYSLSADCTAGTITTIVMNESNKPVQDAGTYLKYIDFSSPLISTGKTDKDGYVLHKLPGNVQLMRGLFILVVEKSGFRSKEVHFDLYPCFHNGSLPPKPPPPSPPQTKPPPTANVTAPNQTNITVPEPPPRNASNGTNESGVIPPSAPPCIPALLLPSALICFGYLGRTGRQGKRPPNRFFNFSSEKPA